MGVMEKNFKNRLLLGQQGNALVTLIAINFVVFIALIFLQIAFSLTANNSFNTTILKWFELPSQLKQLAYKPWTIFLYMFSHIEVLHLIGNMLWLWTFGYILQSLVGNKNLGPLYIYGGLAGAFIFILGFNIFPGFKEALNANASLIGASAGVMAIAIAVTVIAPGYRLFPMLNGGFPLWILTLIFVLVDLGTLASKTNAGGAIAHLAGATIGFFYAKALQKGSNWGNWMHRFSNWISNLFSPAPAPKPELIRQEHFYNTGNQIPIKKTPNLTQQHIDELLDKINQKGYKSLTDDEKAYLKRAAEN